MAGNGSVFISYSHKDEDWKDRLVLHLGVLQHQNLLQCWDDRQIRGGADWYAEIASAIASAQVAILLVSAHSLTSTFILNEEIRRLLDRRFTDGLPILPVIIKPCAWDAVDWLSRMQVRPKDGRPLSSGTDYEIDAALTALSKEVAAALNRADKPVDSGPRSAGSQDRTSADSSKVEVRHIQNHYELIHPISEGRYSRVLKCRRRDSGEICIVKDTEAGRISLNTLYALRDLNCPNLAAPRQIWVDGVRVFEELPYVGGVRLSTAIAPQIGGLTGSVLESFCGQLETTLNCLHKADIVHRDIHPDNIYMVIVKRSGFSGPEFSERMMPAWNYDGFGSGEDGFLIAWVLVDCTFATLSSEAANSHFSHGPYTPEEQVLTAALPESDLYAYGATIYYGITGTEVPAFQTRRLMPGALTVYPEGGHTGRNFPGYLRQLLSLNPADRSGADPDMRQDTVAPFYQGTLQVSKTVFVRCSSADSATRLVAGRDALRAYQDQQKRAKEISEWSFEYAAWLKRDAKYWIDQLAFAGVKDARA
jgi:serine/threonine protein kinase